MCKKLKNKYSIIKSYIKQMSLFDDFCYRYDNVIIPQWNIESRGRGQCQYQGTHKKILGATGAFYRVLGGHSQGPYVGRPLTAEPMSEFIDCCKEIEQQNTLLISKVSKLEEIEQQNTLLISKVSKFEEEIKILKNILKYHPMESLVGSASNNQEDIDESDPLESLFGSDSNKLSTKTACAAEMRIQLEKNRGVPQKVKFNTDMNLIDFSNV
jgi:hypothetical protein